MKQLLFMLAINFILMHFAISQSSPEFVRSQPKSAVSVRMVYVNYPYVAPQVPLEQQNMYLGCQGTPSSLPPICLPPPVQQADFHTAATVDTNPLLAALLLSQALGLHSKAPGFNHPEHLPLNPYVALLLSHYGRYAPIHGTGRNLYGYIAANNYHNNKPFGSYKIYEDS